jgi:hypothetical protein
MKLVPELAFTLELLHTSPLAEDPGGLFAAAYSAIIDSHLDTLVTIVDCKFCCYCSSEGRTRLVGVSFFAARVELEVTCIIVATWMLEGNLARTSSLK